MTSIPVGDWTALAMAKGVPRVTRRTFQETAKRRLAEWLPLELLRVYEPPPGWTEQEYLDHVRVMTTDF